MQNYSKPQLILCLVLSLFLMGFALDPEMSAQSGDLEVILTPVNYNDSDQTVTILNKSAEELDLSGFKIKDGEGNVFEFPITEQTILTPFGVLRVHSGPDASEDYPTQNDFYWTGVSIWTKDKVVRLVDPGGEFVSEIDLSTLDRADRLAGCLTRNNIRLYGLVTCPHCQTQKDEFGSAINYVNYIECRKNRRICGDAGIRNVPAWVRGEQDPISLGAKSLSRLSELTGCSFDG